MADDFSSFKIGDKRRPEVRGRSQTSDEPDEGVSESIGFPAIERRLEDSDVDALAEELRVSYEALEALSQSGDMKQKAGAKKALIAYERTADLFEYLFATKEALGNSQT